MVLDRNVFYVRRRYRPLLYLDKEKVTKLVFWKYSVLHIKGESTVKDKKYLENFYGAMQILFGNIIKSKILFSICFEIRIKSSHFIAKLQLK